VFLGGMGVVVVTVDRSPPHGRVVVNIVPHESPSEVQMKLRPGDLAKLTNEDLEDVVIRPGETFESEYSRVPSDGGGSDDDDDDGSDDGAGAGAGAETEDEAPRGRLRKRLAALREQRKRGRSPPPGRDTVPEGVED